MNELHLFAGAGGGILAGKLIGWRTVCAVERDAYAASVLVARQNDGTLESFPVWDDVRTFDGRPWRGIVDVVSGGFPCQPFSSALRGRRTAQDLWPEMLRIIEEIGPRFVFAENVQREPIANAANDLAERGYVVRCCRASAAAVGAPHRRVRYWLLGDTDGDGKPGLPVHGKMAEHSEAKTGAWDKICNSDSLGMDDGLAHRLDRLKALGSGQVPAVVRLAWEALK